jgi:hypothetical protein
MPDENESVRRGDDDVAVDPVDIQFDQAEYATPAPDGPSCGVCQNPIDSEYYETGGKVCCPSCRYKIEAAFRGGSRVARLLKALFFGSVASAAGAVLYYVILQATGWNIGLVAVVVGVMVGRAVRKGTGHRGGRFYQFLAVFLAYSAIVAMFAPVVFTGLVKGIQNHQRSEPLAAKDDKDASKPGARPKVIDGDKNTPSVAKVDGPKNPAAARKIAAEESAAKPQEESAVVNDGGPAHVKEMPAPHGLAQVLLALLVLSAIWIGLCYTAPIVISVSDPISGLIFGFALWEAWKANRRVELSFNGPFRVSTPGLSEPEPEVHRDGE